MTRIPALDGLRGLAILLVVVFHAWPRFLPGGSYGVVLFFVLSGFLITGVLLREERVDFGRFYWNRAVRLLPALLALLVVYQLVFGHWRSTLFALFYVANVAEITGVEMGRLSHMWSLAVEEHFYVFWPLVLAKIPAVSRIKVTAGLLAAALVWRLVVMMDPSSLARVRYGTDTVAFALLAGCLLALFHHEGRLTVPPVAVTLAAAAGMVAASFVFTQETYGWLWGSFLVVGLSVVAVAGSLRAVPILEHPSLVWLGVVSYGLYLWHVPWLWSRLPYPTVVLLACALVFTWASYRYIESPLRRRLHRPSTELVPA